VTRSRETQLLVEAFLSLINHAAGDLTPEIDEIVVTMRNISTGVMGRKLGLPACQEIFENHLNPALDVLATQHTWAAAKVTQYYLDVYKNKHPNHPITGVEIAACVAGRGYARKTAAIHFVAEQDDCVLFMTRQVHGMESGEGATNASITRMTAAAEVGQLSAAGIGKIVDVVFEPPNEPSGKRLRRLQRRFPEIKP
jgi:hypothetical protein